MPAAQAVLDLADELFAAINRIDKYFDPARLAPILS